MKNKSCQGQSSLHSRECEGKLSSYQFVFKTQKQFTHSLSHIHNRTVSLSLTYTYTPIHHTFFFNPILFCCLISLCLETLVPATFVQAAFDCAPHPHPNSSSNWPCTILVCKMHWTKNNNKATSQKIQFS